jgi:hypothetical protein
MSTRSRATSGSGGVRGVNRRNTGRITKPILDNPRSVFDNLAIGNASQARCQELSWEQFIQLLEQAMQERNVLNERQEKAQGADKATLIDAEETPQLAYLTGLLSEKDGQRAAELMTKQQLEILRGLQVMLLGEDAKENEPTAPADAVDDTMNDPSLGVGIPGVRRGEKIATVESDDAQVADTTQKEIEAPGTTHKSPESSKEKASKDKQDPVLHMLDTAEQSKDLDSEVRFFLSGEVNDGKAVEDMTDAEQ